MSLSFYEYYQLRSHIRLYDIRKHIEVLDDMPEDLKTQLMAYLEQTREYIDKMIRKDIGVGYGDLITELADSRQRKFIIKEIYCGAREFVPGHYTRDGAGNQRYRSGIGNPIMLQMTEIGENGEELGRVDLSTDPRWMKVDVEEKKNARAA